MRSFFIEEKSNNWLFDLDGNVYHPRLRNELSVGMVVGIRVLKKQQVKNERAEILELYKEYDELNENYKKLIEQKEKKVISIKKELNKLLFKSKEKLEEVDNKKEILVQELSNLKKKIKKEKDKAQRKKLGKEISNMGIKIGILNKTAKRYERDINRLEGQLQVEVNQNGRWHFSKASYLIDKCNISKELLRFIDKEYENIDRMVRINQKVSKINKSWNELIFLKLIRITPQKLYGEVIDKFRRLNSKCPLKRGDIISLHRKNVLFVPSILNKQTKLKPYYLTSNIFEYYVAEKITDWNGIFLKKQTLDYITPGSIVRIQLREKNIKLGQVWHALILEEENDYFYGELFKYNRTFEEKYDDPLKTGCILKFPKECIIEIPIIENKTLGFLSKFRNKDRWGYFITGFRFKGSYHDI